jgi:hypothetical protein
MTFQQKLKAVLVVSVVVGVFTLCGISVAQGQLDTKAAIAVGLASLSSATGLAGLMKE